MYLNKTLGIIHCNTFALCYSLSFFYTTTSLFVDIMCEHQLNRTLMLIFLRTSTIRKYYKHVTITR